MFQESRKGALYGIFGKAGEYPRERWTCIGFVTAHEVQGRLLVKSFGFPRAKLLLRTLNCGKWEFIKDSRSKPPEKHSMNQSSRALLIWVQSSVSDLRHSRTVKPFESPSRCVSVINRLFLQCVVGTIFWS
jgi:hypothetical protein